MAEPTSPTSVIQVKKTWSRRDPASPPSRQLKWAEANRAKLRAQSMVRIALRKHKLKRGACEVCGSLRVDAHHSDYDQPLAVTWLCRRHHMLWHSAEKKIANGSIAAHVAALLETGNAGDRDRAMLDIITAKAPRNRKGEAA